MQRAPALSTVRIAALAAATVLAIASKGDIAVLAAALAITAGAWHSTVAVALGLVAASMRVGASSMRAIAGAQSVLGPAGWNGKALAVAATWLAALAIVTAARSVPRLDGRWSPVLVGLPFGAAAAAIAAGPGPGGALAIRVVATALAALAASAVIRVRVRPSADRLVAIAAPVLGAAAAERRPPRCDRCSRARRGRGRPGCPGAMSERSERAGPSGPAVGGEREA